MVGCMHQHFGARVGDHDDNQSVSSNASWENSDHSSDSDTPANLAQLSCLHQGWCNSKRAEQLQRSVQRFIDNSRTNGRCKMDVVRCPIRDPSGRECDAHLHSIGELMTHLKAKHPGAPANAVIEWLEKLKLASKC